MGCCGSTCCGSKSTESASVSLVERAGEGGSVVGGAVAGVAIGSAITGPAAPVGAIIGGIVGAAIGVAVKGSVGAAVQTTQEKTTGFLKDTWRVLINHKEVVELLPDVGVLRTERPFYPPAMSDITMANKYLYETQPALVKGLTYLEALEGVSLSAEQEASLKSAVAELDGKGVLAITADCSAMVAYQQAVAQMTSTPVVLSSLLQAPLLMTMYAAEEKVLVLTSDSSTTNEGKLAAALLKCGVAVEDLPRFVLKGCQEIDGFRTAQLAGQESGTIDAEATAAQLLAMVKETEGSGGGVRAVLLESTMLPMFADVIRKETDCAVFDNITMVDLLHKARTDNPRFGIQFAPSEMPQVRFGKEEMPSVGILRIDYTYPPAMGDAAHPNSYYYRTPHATVKGLTFEAAQAGEPLTEAQRAATQAAISELEEQGVTGIAATAASSSTTRRRRPRWRPRCPASSRRCCRRRCCPRSSAAARRSSSSSPPTGRRSSPRCPRS